MESMPDMLGRAAAAGGCWAGAAGVFCISSRALRAWAYCARGALAGQSGILRLQLFQPGVHLLLRLLLLQILLTQARALDGLIDAGSGERRDGEGNEGFLDRGHKDGFGCE